MLEPALVDSQTVSGKTQLPYFIFPGQRRPRAMQRATSQPPGPCRACVLLAQPQLFRYSQATQTDSFTTRQIDILTYDDRCSNRLYLEMQRAGRMGLHCHTSTALENRTLVLGQDTSLRMRDGGSLQRSMNGLVRGRAANSPRSAQTVLIHPLLPLLAERMALTALQGRGQKHPTTCSGNRTAQVRFELAVTRLSLKPFDLQGSLCDVLLSQTTVVGEHLTFFR